MTRRTALLWLAAVLGAAGVRLWNALAGPLMWGYDAWGHVAYVLFLDLYGAFPYADQGWSTYQPPLHYALGWLLAQAGSAEVLVRGLSLLGGALSLAIAATTAWAARLVVPGRPAAPLVGFCAVAFLPVHVIVGTMPGNEMTVAFFTTATLAVFLANERRAGPSPWLDAATGALAGLAALSKHSGLLALAAVAVSLAARAWPGAGRAAPRALLGRALRVGGVALAVAGPHYAHNLAAYGKLVPTNRDYPLVAQVEAGMGPGSRSATDYLRVPLRTLADPDPRAPHLLHAVWPVLYLGVWADVFREDVVAETPESKRALARVTRGMALVGAIPTVLAFLGAGLAARDALRGRRRALHVPLLALAAGMLLAFAVFAWMVPRWAALKASYCLSLSLPFGVFTARGFDAAARRGPLARGAAIAGLALAVAGSAFTTTEGAALSRRHDAPATGAVYYYFGEYDAARALYGPLVTGSGYAVPWLENLAAVELAAGDAGRARRLSERAEELAARAGRADPVRRGRRAVATALSGDLAAARALLDDGVVDDRADLRANRGAIAAAAGDLAGAERDLVAALALDPELVPAWLDLASVRARRGDAPGARAARSRAAAQACRAPRGHAWGLGTGEILEWGVGRRPLLLLEEGGLAPALPSFYREACARLRAEAS